MSALTTVFFQECPTCGRTLRVAVKYFGRTMSCGHCGGEFVADPNSLRSDFAGGLRSDSGGGLRGHQPTDPTASARVILDVADSVRMPRP
jgi:hypothetical protein